MHSKLGLSIAAALALSAAAGGAARANPIPTSTDGARALAGQVIARQHLDATEPVNGPVTSSDQARAQTGASLPARPGAWVEPMIARNTDEARAAEFAGSQDRQENEPMAARSSDAGAAERGN